MHPMSWSGDGDKPQCIRVETMRLIDAMRFSRKTRNSPEKRQVENYPTMKSIIRRNNKYIQTDFYRVISIH